MKFSSESFVINYIGKIQSVQNDAFWMMNLFVSFTGTIHALSHIAKLK